MNAAASPDLLFSGWALLAGVLGAYAIGVGFGACATNDASVCDRDAIYSAAVIAAIVAVVILIVRITLFFAL